MSSFLDRLVLATQWGAALAVAAGCGSAVEASEPEPPSTTVDASVDASDDSDASDAADASDGSDTADAADALPDAYEDAGPLPETPYPDPTCFGPHYDGGYYGQCCEEVACIDPVNGGCPLGSEISGAQLPGFPPGSGSCSCGDAIKGPFAPQKTGESACCYLFGSISCEGRPLVVNAVMRLAPVVARTDWGARKAPNYG